MIISTLLRGKIFPRLAVSGLRFAGFALLSSALALMVCDLRVHAQTRETFQQVNSPGGLLFWHVQRAEAPRAVILGSFVDAFALNHPDKIAAPVVGAALMHSGPKGMSSGEFMEQVKDLQARGGVGSAVMSASFSVEAKPEELSEALDLYFSTLSDPALREADFDRLRKGSIASRARLESDPNALSGYLMRKLTLFNSPFGRWAEPEEVAKITADDVNQWRREVFARDNLTIVAVGNLDAATFGAMIDRTFGTLPEKSISGRGEAPSPVYSGKTIVFEREAGQTAVLMEGPLMIEPAEAAAVNVGGNVLGGGLDRRLSRAVRGEQGATYGISAGAGQLAPGQRNFGIRSALANDLAIAALKRARDEYDRWRSGDVTDEEAAGARSLLATNFDKSAESPSGKAFSLVALLRTGRTAQDEAAYADRMREIGVAEINRVLREKMPRQLTTVIVAPKADGFGADCVIRAVSELEKCR